MTENYMDRFETAEEFIRSEILANRGTDSVVTKQELAYIAGWTAGEGEKLDKMTKAQLLDLLIRQYGPKAYSMFPVGVPSLSWQLKFGITHKQLMRLAKAGIVTVTGERRFRMYGRNCYAKVFSAYDYFRLTPAEVTQHIAILERRGVFARTKEVKG